MTEKRMTSLERKRLRRRRKMKRSTSFSKYKLVVWLVIIFGSIVLCSKAYDLWQIRLDMQNTLQQEQSLRDENERLKQRKESLNDKEEVARQAREQFGLVKPGEVPYRK